MKVEIRLTQDAYEPYAVIYTNEITDEVRETADSIHASNRREALFFLQGISI